MRKYFNYKKTEALPNLRLLPRQKYPSARDQDPIRFYFLPIIGQMYRRRVEFCLAECSGGERVLEIGFGSGVTFLNLHEIYNEVHGIDLTSDIDKVTKAFKDQNIATYLKKGNILDIAYNNNFFDTVLLVSVLEHLNPEDLIQAFIEIHRVLKPGGQVVYGIPIDRPLMLMIFRLLGYNIREHHFSTEKDILAAAMVILKKVRLVKMNSFFPMLGPIYEIGHFVK